MTDEFNPTSRALRATEVLGLTYPGLTTQEAVTACLQDIMHLQDEYPDKLHFEGAMEDAREAHDGISGVNELADVVNLEEERFKRGHQPGAAELEAEQAEADRLMKRHPSVTLLKDGDQWIAHGPDFVNLKESQAAFAPTPAEAVAMWQKRLGEDHGETPAA